MRRNSIIKGGLAWCVCLALSVFSTPAETNSSAPLKYEEPKLLTGTIYAKDSDRKHPLFTFTRKATRSGSTLKVIREYNNPEGKLVAQERVHYEGDTMVSYELEDFQTGERGKAVIGAEAGKSSQRTIYFQWSKDEKSRNKPQTREEALRKDVLINDMVAPFLISHWEELSNGREVKCHYIVLPRRETVGFTFTKEREESWTGRAVVILKMEPTSPIIAELVDPLYFTIEKEGPHRVLKYTGRTTPKIQSGKKWKDLDATTEFDWK